ncbi:hypothetical protein J5N97_016289 [Dioscorea zingiberensis]|uniref:Uncharacterized protein n=1 Tax=Dioscorea zingiberensis TaxID=325984 RepID=A0A9D5CK34_9LILI|nr:hypothetical protein J5N97_016289 [Dioscorea zingiberensis]
MISLSLAVTSMEYLATLARDPNVRIRIYQVYEALEGINSSFKSSAEHLYSSSTLKKLDNRPSTYLIPYQEVQELLDDPMSRLSDTAENLDQLWQTLEAHDHLKLALKMVAGDVRVTHLSLVPWRIWRLRSQIQSCILSGVAGRWWTTFLPATTSPNKLLPLIRLKRNKIL